MASSRLIPAINRLSGTYSNLWDIYPFIEGLDMLQIELETQNKTSKKLGNGNKKPNDWQELKLVDVSHSYSEETGSILNNLSLNIQKNKSYGIVGPSGAGKSTLIDICLGLIIPTEGDLILDGIHFSEIDISYWQQQIGYVPQSPFIADDTLSANVAFGRPSSEIDKDKVYDCLKMACLDDIISILSDGINTEIGERGMRLSGGQRQRVAIARALYNNPTILVLDEATSSLDTISEHAIQNSIDSLHGKLTTITIAHRLSTIQDCDEIFLIEDGRLITSGSYEQLSKKAPLFRKLLAQKDVPLNYPITNSPIK